MNAKYKNHLKKKYARRKKIFGSFTSPRLSIYISIDHIYIQAIDDYQGITLLSINSITIKEQKNFIIGKLFGQMLIEKGFSKVVFDCNRFSYSVNLSKLVNGIRTSGINI